MKALLLALLAVAFLAWHGGALRGSVDDSVLRSFGRDECAHKERCLAVYLTPWCPHCRQSGPIVEELRLRAARSRSVGFKVVVGRDTPEALERYAAHIGGAVHFDDDGEFWAQIGVRGVPAWVAWDADGRILEHMEGRPMGAAPRLLADHVVRELGLEGL